MKATVKIGKYYHDLDEDEEESRETTGIICKVWNFCQHPEICQKSCFDKDLVRDGKA